MKIQVVRNLAISGLFFVLAIASVQAQTPGRVEVTVPFDFVAGKATLKAGAYTVKRMAGNALAIRSADGKTTAMVNAPLAIGSRESRSGQRLVFNKYGDQYFLSQVWMGVDSGRQLFPGKGEASAARAFEVANNKAKPERIEIAVRAQ
jgi:hypothetical protein